MFIEILLTIIILILLAILIFMIWKENRKDITDDDINLPLICIHERQYKKENGDKIQIDNKNMHLEEHQNEDQTNNKDKVMNKKEKESLNTHLNEHKDEPLNKQLKENKDETIKQLSDLIQNEHQNETLDITNEEK